MGNAPKLLLEGKARGLESEAYLKISVGDVANSYSQGTSVRDTSRLAIAMHILTFPALVLDEPTSGLGWFGCRFRIQVSVLFQTSSLG